MEWEEEFLRFVRQHAARYPQMQPQDYGKLAYQSEYGPEHLITDEAAAAQAIREEWAAVAAQPQERPETASAAPQPEPIGGGLCRFALTGAPAPDAPECLAFLLCRSAREHTGTPEGLARRLAALETLHIPHLAGWLTSYRTQGMPAVHHSPLYRAAYQPHYRVLRAEYATYFPAILAVYRLARAGARAVVAIDGRCGSGKSTLGGLLARLFGCTLLHTDDYYLPLDQRAPGWEQTPGGNMDFARLRAQALKPALAGQPIAYRAYSCQQGQLLPAVPLPPKALTILEGSYSMHPALQTPYAVRIFLDCAPEEQARRLRAREGEYFAMFQQRWIPLEEGYFAQYRVRQRCDLVLDTSLFCAAAPQNAAPAEPATV